MQAFYESARHFRAVVSSEGQTAFVFMQSRLRKDVFGDILHLKMTLLADGHSKVVLDLSKNDSEDGDIQELVAYLNAFLPSGRSARWTGAYALSDQVSQGSGPTVQPMESAQGEHAALQNAAL